MLEMTDELAERKSQRRKTVKKVIYALIVVLIAITLIYALVAWGQTETVKDALLEDAKILLVANELNLETKEVMSTKDADTSYDTFTTTKGEYMVKFTTTNNRPKLKSIIPVLTELED